MTFKGNSRSSTMSYFAGSPGLNQNPEKYATLIFRGKIAKTNLKVDQNRSRLPSVPC